MPPAVFTIMVNGVMWNTTLVVLSLPELIRGQIGLEKWCSRIPNDVLSIPKTMVDWIRLRASDGGPFGFP